MQNNESVNEVSTLPIIVLVFDENRKENVSFSFYL